MKWVVVVVLLGALVLNVDALIDAGALVFIREYLQFKMIRVVYVRVCTDIDGFRVRKALSEVTFWLESGQRLEDLAEAYHKIGVVVDHDCAVNQRFLDESSAAYLFNATHHWLVISHVNPTTLVDKRLSTFNFNFASEVTWAFVDNATTISLHDLYKLQYTLPPVVQLAGNWTVNDGLHYTLTSYSVVRRGDLRGITFKTALVVNEMPLDNVIARMTSLVDKELDTGTRISYSVVKHLAEMFNFRLEEMITSTWGYKDPVTGVTLGLVGLLMRKEVEIGSSALRLFPERVESLDILGPVWEFSPTILFVHPSSVGVQNALLAPFTAHAWYATALVMAMVTATLRMAWYIERPSPGSEPGSWSSALMIGVGAISLQGTSHDSSTLTWRIVFLSALVLAFFFYNFYAAYVVSSLLLPEPKTITDLRALIDSPLKFGADMKPYTTFFFETTTDPLAQELYRKKMFPASQAAPNFYSIPDGVNKMRTEMFAYHCELFPVSSMIENSFNEVDKCKLTSIQLMPPATTYMFTQKTSPFREMFIYGMRSAHESGCIQRQNRYWKPEPPRCVPDAEEVVSVEMHIVSSAFLILFAGVILAMIILCVELAVQRFRSNAKIRRRPTKRSRDRLVVHRRQIKLRMTKGKMIT